jgi:hypothetical protein
MITPSRLALSASAVLAAALLLVGCTGSAETPPTSSATPDDSSSIGDVGDDFEAAWLDDGRMFSIVTWGSSSCVPIVDEISAEGQKVTLSLSDAPDDGGAEKVCTADFAPRASIGGLPAGVDPTKDVEFVVTLGEITEDVELDGNAALTGTPGDATDYLPSAGWFDDEGIVLLTWGSSTCPPVVENVDVQDAGATVTFATEDGACTMDMVPRATLLGMTGDVDDDEDFVLTLVGGNLDAAVNVLRG